MQAGGAYPTPPPHQQLQHQEQHQHQFLQPLQYEPMPLPAPAPAPAPAPTPEQPTELCWVCQLCTFKNPAKLQECEMCGGAQPDAPMWVQSPIEDSSSTSTAPSSA